LPAFKGDMTPIDVMELVQATYQLQANAQTDGRDVRPVKIGGRDGFRFDMSVVGRDEVEREATALGWIKDKKLNLIIYSGAKLHYYPKYQPSVERIFASVSGN